MKRIPYLARRDFIRGSLAMGTILILPRNILAQGASPNAKLNIAMIGLGYRGGQTLHALPPEAQPVAFCDVDRSLAGKAAALYPDAPFFQDYRRMYDALRDTIDGVLISTPDHSHFHLARRALREKKPVFVEKPLAQTITEARQLSAAAATAGVATQMGNQGHAGQGVRLLQEWYEAGVLGAVRRVVLFKPRSHPVSRFGTAIVPTGTPPPTIDWEGWIGPRPMTGYSADLARMKWRSWWDYGDGTLGDFGCHFMDAAFTALQLGAPVSAVAEGQGATPINFPSQGQKIVFQFPARGDQPSVELVWLDGTMIDAKWRAELLGQELAANADTAGMNFDSTGPDMGFIIGDKAIVQQDMYANTVRIVPETKFRELRDQLPPPRLPRVKGGIISDWLAGIRGERVPCSNFQVAARLTEAVLVGNLALRTGQEVTWDAARMTTGNPAVDKYLDSEPRKGWEI